MESMSRNNSINLNCKDRFSVNAFWIAAYYGQDEAVRFLHGKGIDTNCTNSNGSNALHIASKRGALNVVSELLRLDYPLNTPKHNGVTACGIAAHHSNLALLRLLGDAGADLNIINN